DECVAAGGGDAEDLALPGHHPAARYPGLRGDGGPGPQPVRLPFGAGARASGRLGTVVEVDQESLRSKRPMRELILLRHAHAEPATTGQSDLDRPLSPQGLAEAEAVARWLKEQGLVPDR